MIKCICINDQNRPNDISKSEWIKLNQIYTVNTIVAVDKLNIAIVLNEINLSKDETFKGFNVSRFGFIKEDVLDIIYVLEDCDILSKTDSENLLNNNFYIGDDLNDFEDFLKSSDDDKDLGDL